MRKILGIGLVAVLALVGANTVQAAYISSIGLNFADGITPGDAGYVTGLQDGYQPQNYWYNVKPYYDPVLEIMAPIVNLSTVGIKKYSSGTGTSIDPLLFNLDSYANALYPGFGIAEYASGTVGYAGIGTVNSFTIAGIPYASYDVAIMVGYYWKDVAWELLTGGNGSVSRQVTATGVTGHPDPLEYNGVINFTGVRSGVGVGSTFTFTGNNGTFSYPNGDGVPYFSENTIYAIQILETSGSSVPEPGTWLLLGGSLLGLCVGGFRRFRK